MLNGPFQPWPSFTQEEADVVSQVLLSNQVNYWTGTQGRNFEKEFATWCETKHAIAVANGTLALDLIFAGLEVGSAYGGDATDEVIVTPRSFIASVSSVVNAGATPVFTDVDRNSGNLSAATISDVITPNTKAIVVVHLAGWPCDMDPIVDLAKAHGIKLIEDCAQAHGATYKGRPVGVFGDAAAWSFCQDKIMTTGGEGGVVTTDDKDLWSRMWSFKDHGKSYDAVYNRSHPAGFRWVHESFGTNWRLTEMQAAIGRIQLGRMPEWSAARAQNAAQIAAALATFSSVRVPVCPDESRHAFYKFYAYVVPENLQEGWTRDRIVQEITALGVPCMQGSCSEIYLEKAFNGTDWRPSAPLPTARELGETSLMFLVHPTLTAQNIAATVSAIETVFAKASV